jgi:hypothetical protein
MSLERSYCQALAPEEMGMWTCRRRISTPIIDGDQPVRRVTFDWGQFAGGPIVSRSTSPTARSAGSARRKDGRPHHLCDHVADVNGATVLLGGSDGAMHASRSDRRAVWTGSVSGA